MTRKDLLRTACAFAALGAFAVQAAPRAAAQTPVQREDLIWKAGFKPYGYGTPMYDKAAKALPPHKFVHHTANGTTTYYYFDPTICACVYEGTEANWQAYKSDTSSRLHMDAELAIIKDDMPFTGAGG